MTLSKHNELDGHSSAGNRLAIKRLAGIRKGAGRRESHGHCSPAIHASVGRDVIDNN